MISWRLARLTLCGLLVLGAVDVETALKIIDKEINELVSRQVPNRVTARELEQSYDLNAVSADREFNGKIIAVTGPIRDISRDPYNQLPVVTLSTVTPEAWRSGNEMLSRRDIGCYFSKNREGEVMLLYKRQPDVTLIGKVAGATQFEITIVGCRVIYR